MKDEKSNVTIERGTSARNQGHGIWVGKNNVDLQIIDTDTSGNAGDGIHISDASSPESENENNKPNEPHKWYQKPRGVLLLMVFGGLILWGIKILVTHYFPNLRNSS